MIFSNCLRCGTALQRTTQLIENQTVVNCPKCDLFALEGDGKWFGSEEGSADDILKALKERAWKIDRKRMDDERHEAMFWGDMAGDPRWEVV